MSNRARRLQPSRPRSRPLITLAIAALGAACVGVFAGQPAAASPTALEVSGSFTFVQATALPPGCLSPLAICDHSTFTGTLAGPADVAVMALIPSLDPGRTFANSTAVLHTTSGDIQLKESASANLSGDGEFASLLEITGGTGRYAGASGYLAAHGTSTIALLGSLATPFMATGQGDYVGKVRLA